MTHEEANLPHKISTEIHPSTEMQLTGKSELFLLGESKIISLIGKCFLDARELRKIKANRHLDFMQRTNNQ